MWPLHWSWFYSMWLWVPQESILWVTIPGEKQQKLPGYLSDLLRAGRGSFFCILVVKVIAVSIQIQRGQARSELHLLMREWPSGIVFGMVNTSLTTETCFSVPSLVTLIASPLSLDVVLNVFPGSFHSFPVSTCQSSSGSSFFSVYSFS